MVECPVCGGKGCAECGDRGQFAVTQCPQLELTPDMNAVIELAELMRRGLPPIRGGSLDQAQQFLDAARLINSETAYWTYKLNPLGALSRDL